MQELKRIVLSTLIAALIIGPLFFIEPTNSVVAPDYPLWADIYGAIFGLFAGAGIYELSKKIAEWILSKFNQ